MIDQIFSEQSLNIQKTLLIITPLLLITFAFFKWKKTQTMRLYILENAAVCIALMIIYFFLYHILPESIKYLVVIILIASLGFMTLSMFASFKVLCSEVMTVTDAVRIAAVILFFNTALTLVHKMVSYYNIHLLDAAILFIILCLYFWFFFKAEDSDSAYVFKCEIKTPRRTLLLLAALMFLLSIGYGPFINSLRKTVINTHPYAFIYLRLLYLLGLSFVYVFVERFKQYYEVFMMFLVAIIVIAHLLVCIINNQATSFVMTLIIQFTYPVLHAFLGGLLIMLSYLFHDTYHNMYILTATAFISMVAGILLPALIVGQAFLNILCTLIFSVIAMVLIIFTNNQVFAVFSKATDDIKQEKAMTDRLKNLELYSTLTPREKEILEYLITDYNNKIISEKLNISENTLKKHSKNIYTKLSIKNKNALKKSVGTD